MQFLKRHYEKIILSIVLIALGASAVWLSTAISNAKATPEAAAPGGGSRPASGASGVADIDLRPLEDALKGMKEVPHLKLTIEHNLFNPVVWKLKPDGTLFKMTLGGAAAVSILDIRPFYYTISLDSASGSGWYLIEQPAKGKPSKAFYNLKDKATKTKPIVVESASGTNDVVTLQLRLPDEDEPVTVAMGKPYKRVEGYDADLDYRGSDEKKKIMNLGVNSDFTLSGESYKLFALTNNSLTLQDTRTLKKTTIDWIGQH